MKKTELHELATLCDLTDEQCRALIKADVIPAPSAGLQTCVRAYVHWLRAGKKTVEECCELLDITPRHWTRLKDEGVVILLPTGEPDFRKSVASYIRHLRDGVTMDSRELRKRKLAADTSIAERKDAEAACELVPVSEYVSNYTEAVTKVCLAISRLESLTEIQKAVVIDRIKAVELEPLEFEKEPE